MDLKGTAKIECIECGHIFESQGSDMWLDVAGSSERGMGEEIYLHGQLEYRCEKCSNEITIECEASEYPIGMLNFQEISVKGGELIRGYEELDFSQGEEELYSFDEQFQLYLPEKKEIICSISACVSELILKASKKPELLYQLKPREFEELIAEIFARENFSVELTPQTKDGGKDIIAIKSGSDRDKRYIIECKRYAKKYPVGVGLVRSLYGVQCLEGADKSILATTSHFTRGAKKFADETQKHKWNMSLKNYNDIVSWLKKSTIS